MALARLLDREDGSNAVVGRDVGLVTSCNIIRTEGPYDVVVAVGLHVLVVVMHGNTLLLVAKERIASLKHILGDDRLSNLF